MTKAILLSIHPKWSKLIYEGDKTIEWRKTMPQRGQSYIVYIYETSPVKKITGWFWLDSILCINFNGNDYNDFRWDLGCVSLDELKQYQGKNKFVYGWRPACPQKFDKPKTLADFGLKRPPQSWCYTEVCVNNAG